MPLLGGFFNAEIHRPVEHCHPRVIICKEFTEKDIKAQLIAIIDSENLMPGYASCTEQASKYSIAFSDFAKWVKAVAGMY